MQIYWLFRSSGHFIKLYMGWYRTSLTLYGVDGRKNNEQRFTWSEEGDVSEEMDDIDLRGSKEIHPRMTICLFLYYINNMSDHASYMKYTDLLMA